MAYYGISGLPGLVWAGTIQSSGASTQDALGLNYAATIQSLLPVPSAFKLTVNSASLTPPLGSIDIDVEVMEAGVDVSNMYLRMALTEDGVPYGGDIYDDVTRDMATDVAITVSNLGEIQNVVGTFAIDPTWVTSNLEVISFLQDDNTKKIHAAITSDPPPEYSLRYYATGSLQHVGPSSGFFYFEDFEIFNLGSQTDTYTVDLTGTVPPGWSTGICDEVVCFGPTFSTDLAPGESQKLHILVIPSSPGYVAVNVEMSQASVTPEFPRVIKYNYITDDVDVLLVDDDGAEDYEEYFAQALTDAGISYGIWDRLTVGPEAATLDIFPAVVWSTGLQYPTLDASDRAAIGAYLDGGGALFVTGQDIGWELDDQGGAAYAWYQNYLHANFIADDTNDYTLTGVAGDPISNGLDLVTNGGDGANNQAYPDDIDPADGAATVIWSYDAARNGAIRADTGTYKVVYLAFGYEAINNATDRREVLERSLNWLTLPPTPAGWVSDDDPLTVGKTVGGKLDLNWGTSCLASDVDYAVYEGTLGNYTTHVPKTCSTGGSTNMILSMGLGNKYYLIVPSSVNSEGSYGTTSTGAERAASLGACAPQLIGVCP